ncbi:MAG TPA: thioesterase family protein [Candidatus Thermoplasmatota archaeon]|nr:thioesterase family protein [Candidatus Thermoplasmatota archaeon]
MPVTTRFPVRYREVDMMGHVNNAAYVSYLEDARVAYVRRLGAAAQLDPSAFPFILARVEVDYRAPLHLGDEVEIAIEVARIGRSSFDFAYRMTRAREPSLVAEARTVQVWYDYAKGASAEIPPWFRDAVARVAGERTP